MEGLQETPVPIIAVEQNSEMPPINQNNNAQNLNIEPHNPQVLAQQLEVSESEQPQVLPQKVKEPLKENEITNNDHSENAMFSSNNPEMEKNMLEESQEEAGLSFLNEEGDSLFSSGFEDSFDLSRGSLNRPANYQPNPSRFRFK